MRILELAEETKRHLEASASAGSSTTGPPEGSSMQAGGWQSCPMVLGGFGEGTTAEARAGELTDILETQLSDDRQEELAEPSSPPRPTCNIAEVKWSSQAMASRAAFALNVAFRHDTVKYAGFWAVQERHPDEGRRRRIMKEASE